MYSGIDQIRAAAGVAAQQQASTWSTSTQYQQQQQRRKHGREAGTLVRITQAGSCRLQKGARQATGPVLDGGGSWGAARKPACC